MDHTEKSKATEHSLDLDDLLSQVGEFGRYQQLIIFLICLPSCFPCAFNAFNQLFMTFTPDHWCALPELNQSLINDLDAEIEGVPLLIENNGSRSHCSRYNYYNHPEEADRNESSTWRLEGCLDGWVYNTNPNTSGVSSSVVIDFDLVCEKEMYPTFALVAMNLGGLFGVYFFGVLMDTIGRKKTYFACLTTLLVGNVMSYFSTDFWWWIGSRSVIGLTIPSFYQVPFVLSLEIVGPKFRSLVTILICFTYAIALATLAGVAYLIRDWKTLTLTTSMPFAIFYLSWPFLPESPRWLLVKGRFEEASNIIERLARINGKELPSSFKQELKQRMVHTMTSSEEALMKKSYGLSSLCGTPNMRLKTCLVTVTWFVSQTVYVGLCYYGPALGSNAYLNFMLSAVAELPAVLGIWIVIDNWGRRWPLSCSLIICSATCLASGFTPPEQETTILVLYLVAKSAASAALTIVYPFCGELYPTQLRGVGMGVSAYVAGIGLLVIPFVTYLGTDNSPLPLTIMGAMSIVGGLCVLRLPETLHYRLPQTVEEGEEFGKDFSMKDLCRCIPLKPVPVTSYEDLELEQVKEEVTEETPLEQTKRRSIYKKLTRQGSTLDTPKEPDGTMKMTLWY